MQTDWRVVPAADYRRERWRNGLGWTTEILRVPDAEDWRWRLSLAESDQDAEFSAFPGVDRELVLLTGNGLRLRFDDGESLELRARYQNHRFSAERPVTGELIDGPTRQLNLMWRRDAVRAELTCGPIAEPVPLACAAGEERAVHLITGSAQILGGSKAVPLHAGDTALLVGDLARGSWIEGVGEVALVAVTAV
jgi:environmental stress-induced protein Ves